MKNIFKTLAAVLIGAIMACLISSCGKQEKLAGKIGVATTILPQAEFVRNLGGDKVEVTVMVPPGASPHTYEPTPAQMKELARAKLYVMTGSGVEFELVWMDKIIQNNKNLVVVDCSKGISIIETKEHNHEDIKGTEKEPHHGKDPHIWLSPKNAKIMVENIYAGLIKIDPVNKNFYNQNKIKYLQQLDSLDKKIKDGLKDIQNRNFMVFHPAWGYFAKDYNLKQIPVEIEGKEPSAKDISNLIDLARKNNIKVVFVSPQFNPKSAAVIAQGIGGKVVFIDPLAENYIQNMLLILDKFSNL